MLSESVAATFDLLREDLTGPLPALLLALVTVLIVLRSRLAAVRDELSNTRELIEHLSEGVYRSLPDGRQLSANKALVKLNGYESEAEMLLAVRDIGREWYVEPRRRDEFRAILRREGHVSDFVSEIFRHKTRERIWITESARLVRHKKTGRPLYYEGSVREITETLQRLRLEEQFRKLTSEVPGALFQFAIYDDGSSAVHFVSPRFATMTSIDEELLKRRPQVFGQRVFVDDRDAFRAAIARSRANLLPWESEFRISLPDGTSKWLRVTATPERVGSKVVFHGYLSDISLRKKNEKAIEKLAFFDSLTELPNRRMFKDRIAASLAACSRQQRFGALLFIDLDNFKTLNDSHGHDLGDRYLVHAAARLRACVGADDMAARIGGDEFVVVIDGLGSDRAEATRASIMTANRVLSAMREDFAVGDVIHRSSASVGVVVYDGSEAKPDEVLKNADIAMYRAKAAGRNGVALFSEELLPAAPASKTAAPTMPAQPVRNSA